jgi:hypothetical protein
LLQQVNNQLVHDFFSQQNNFFFFLSLWITVPKFNHPAPQKKIFSFANPQPIRTPFNIYYNPVRRPFLSHSHQIRPFSPVRRPKIIYLIFCPHLAAPLKNIIFAG